MSLKPTEFCTWFLILPLLAAISCQQTTSTPKTGADNNGQQEPLHPVPANDAEPAPAATNSDPNGAGKAKNVHVLLVGCTTYDNLAANLHLAGPANDVELVRKLLVDKFNFDEKQITTLAEKRGAVFRPTRSNIQREFQRLARSAAAGDRVVILLSGHGSWQPSDPNNREDVKPDGRDEVFCPADVSGLRVGDKAKIEGAIVDKDFKKWLAAIQQTGASVWFIADSCHSGTLARGDDVPRGFDPGELLSPAERDKLSPGRGTTRGSGENAVELPTATKGSLVALYATQPYEETYESTFDGRKYGILTHALCHVLTQCETPITYRELVQRIHARYVEQNRYRPTPLLEGQRIDAKSESRDLFVLGTTVISGRSRISLRRADNGQYKVNAGALHDLTAGSVLAVYPAAGKAGEDELLAHVRVSQVEALEAIAEPCEFGGKPLRKDIPDENRCEVVFFDYGLRQLRLAVDPLGEKDLPRAERESTVEPVPADRLESLRKRLQSLDRGQGSLVKLVSDLRNADWLVRIRAGNPYLVHKSVTIGKPPADLPVFGPIPEDAEPTLDKLVDWLGIRLTRIARASNLTRLAASSPEEANPSRKTVNVEVHMLRYADKSGKNGTPINWQRDGLNLKAGEIIGFRVTNRSRVPVDVSLLFVDSAFGIDQNFPEPGTGGNRLRPAKSDGDSFETVPSEVKADTVGTEHLIVIAVTAKSQKEPIEFTFLEQPNCARSERSRGEDSVPRGSEWDFPLGQFLIQAKTDIQKARGLGRVSIDAHALRLFTWRTAKR